MTSIQQTIENSSAAVSSFRVPRRGVGARFLFLIAMGAALTFSSVVVQGQTTDATQPPQRLVQTDVKLVIGGDTIKNNSRVTLTVMGSSLYIAFGKTAKQVDCSSILDISTNEDSRQDITGAAKLATMAIPYGGGRVLSLFSHSVDVLTLEYTDANGGYHGAVFVLDKGQAAPIKKQLVAMGAKASAPLEEAAPANK